MSRTNLQQQITVHALPSKVWKVLTSPQYLRQYFLREISHCDWTEGSPIISFTGRTQPASIGQVLESIPGMLLKFNCLVDEPAAFVTTTYELIIASDGVDLKMKWEGLVPTNHEFQARLHQANLILEKIKWLSEYS